MEYITCSHELMTHSSMKPPTTPTALTVWMVSLRGCMMITIAQYYKKPCVNHNKCKLFLTEKHVKWNKIPLKWLRVHYNLHGWHVSAFRVKMCNICINVPRKHSVLQPQTNLNYSPTAKIYYCAICNRLPPEHCRFRRVSRPVGLTGPENHRKVCL